MRLTNIITPVREGQTEAWRDAEADCSFIWNKIHIIWCTEQCSVYIINFVSIAVSVFPVTEITGVDLGSHCSPKNTLQLIYGSDWSSIVAQIKLEQPNSYGWINNKHTIARAD